MTNAPFPSSKSPRFDWIASDQASRQAIELTTYGLTLSQARIYLYLLVEGPSPARRISEALELHRVDVYRKLGELQELGLLELYLDSPKRYSAISPASALSTLVHRQEQSLAAFKQKSLSIIPKLESFRRTAYNQTHLLPSDAKAPGLYRLVQGRSRYYEEMRALIRDAEHEVLRIVSAGGLVRTFLSGLNREYAQAKRRGVSLRMISEFTPENRTYAKRLSQIVNLRHLDAVHLRFVVVDRERSIIGARFDDASRSLEEADDSYLVFEDKKFAEVFCFFFDHLWDAAKDFR